MHLKRILFSILVGTFSPILYAAAGGILVDYVLPEGFDTAQMSGQQVPGLLFAPIAVPVYVDTLLNSYEYLGFRHVLDNVWFRSTFFMLFNFLFYSIVVYLVLSRLEWFSKTPIGDERIRDQASEIRSS
jgi:hypothetical protein